MGTALAFTLPNAWAMASWMSCAADAEEAVEAAPMNKGTAKASLEQVLASQMSRVAILDLRSIASPQASDYGVAALLLELAGRARPDDVELVRRRAEAAWNWGDQAALESATRRILELDPADTMAQLRLLSSRFNALQTVEAKLAAFDKAGEAKSLDAAVRSRFLLDAALLAREQGDEVGFAKRLSRAIELDSTNKDAAVLALAFFESRREDRWGRLDLLTNLLLADPLDPQVHAKFVREYAAGGAYEQARRFMRNIAALLQQGGLDVPADTVLETTVLDILCDGPQRTYADLNARLARVRAQIAKQLKALEEANQPTAGLPKPEEIRLDMDQEAIRILCAAMMGDQPGLATAVEELSQTAAKNVERLKDPLQRPADMGDEEAAKFQRIAIARVELWRLALGVGLDKVEGDLAAALGSEKDTVMDVAAIRAMIAARAGEFDKALALVGGSEESDPWLTVASGLALESKGDIAGAIAALRAGQEAGPLSPQGALAGVLADRMQVAHGVAPLPERAAAKTRLEDHARSIERWVDQMAREARWHQAISVRLEAPEADTLSPVSATVTVKNTSSRPLALGAGKPINSRLLIAQSVDAGGRSLNALASAEVVDAQRRLRLMPGEAVEVRYALDDGASGWLLETMSGATGQIRLRVVQGFEVKANGAREPGPGCLETLAASFSRRPLAESRLRPQDLARLLASSTPDVLPTLLIAARSHVVMPPPEGVAVVIEAIAQRYPKLSVNERALVVAIMPPAIEVPELQVLDEAIAKETDPGVLGVAIVTRGAAEESPLLTAGKACTDETVRRLAELHAERLANATQCYATKGTGLVKPLRELLGIVVADPVVAPEPAPAPAPVPASGTPQTPKPADQPGAQPAAQPQSPPVPPR